MDCSRKTPSQSLTSFRVVMRTKPSLSGPSLCSPLSCSSFQAKTESCNAPWSRFLATLIAEQLAEVPTNVFQDRIQQRTPEQISDTPVSAGSGGTRGGLHSFLQGQGSTAFWGADLPYSRYFTRCQEGHFRALLFVPRRAPVDLFETNKKPIGWSHRRPQGPGSEVVFWSVAHVHGHPPLAIHLAVIEQYCLYTLTCFKSWDQRLSSGLLLNFMPTVLMYRGLNRYHARGAS